MLQTGPIAFWAPAMQLGFMVFEAQAVIAMRVLGMAGVWSMTPAEDSRMVLEKVHALNRSAMAATNVALSGGTPDQVMSAAIKPIRNKTRSNAKRLRKRGMKTGRTSK